MVRIYVAQLPRDLRCLPIFKYEKLLIFVNYEGILNHILQVQGLEKLSFLCSEIFGSKNKFGVDQAFTQFPF